MEKTASIKITATTDKHLEEKEKCLQMLAQNLDRDSMVILANKSSKAGINEKIKQYQHFM